MALIKGTADADNLVSKNIGADTLYGYDGDDTLDGGGGANRLVGGLGNDRYILRSTAEVVVEQPGEGIDTIQASFSIDLRKAAYANVENVELTGLTALRIDGSAGANVLYGNAIGNTIHGHDGDDVIAGFGGNDSLDGGNGNDVLFGGTGRDTLLGGAGNDTLTGDEGGDSLVGGTGDDTYNVDSASDVVKEAAGEGTDTVEVAYAGNVSLAKWANVENLTMLAAGATKITGTAAANVLRGNDDGDVIDGQDGHDTLVGGAGNDTYDLGTTGYGFGHPVISDAEGGNDQVLFGANLRDLVFSRSGDDLLIKFVPQDIPAQYRPDDQATIKSFFAAGANSIERFVANGRVIDRAAVVAMTLPGHVLTGTSGNDDLSAPDNAGPDTLIGGMGDDTYRIASSKDVVVERPGEGTDTICFNMAMGDGYDLSTPEAAGVENLIATAGSVGGGALKGNALDNFIQGSQTVGTVYRGGQGHDTLVGGTGNDRYEFSRGDGQYVIDDAGGTGDVLGLSVERTSLAAQRAGQDLILKVRDTQDQITVKHWFDGPTSGLEAIYTLGFYSTPLSRTDIDNMLQAGSLINGGGGNDTLQASGVGLGDTLVGGAGDDTYLVYSSSDKVVEQPGEGIDTVVINQFYNATYSLDTPESAGVENLAFGNASSAPDQPFLLTGNALDNQIGVLNSYSSRAGSVLEGLGGNDTLYSDRYGQFTLVGGSGNDTYVIAYGNAPKIVEDANGGIDTLDESQGYQGQGQGAVRLTDAQCANVENAIWRTGAGGSVLQGNDLGNVLTILADHGIFDGGKGNDTLVGNDSGCSFTGGLDNDEIRSGQGGDHINFQAGDGQDTIVDLGGSDQLTLTGIAASDLLLAKSASGTDLVIGFASHAADRITVSNWFGSADAQIESIVTSSGTVSNQAVNALLQAMAAGGAVVGIPAGSVVAPATAAVIAGGSTLTLA